MGNIWKWCALVVAEPDDNDFDDFDDDGDRDVDDDRNGDDDIIHRFEYLDEGREIQLRFNTVQDEMVFQVSDCG